MSLDNKPLHSQYESFFRQTQRIPWYLEYRHSTFEGTINANSCLQPNYFPSLGNFKIWLGRVPKAHNHPLETHVWDAPKKQGKKKWNPKSTSRAKPTWLRIFLLKHKNKRFLQLPTNSLSPWSISMVGWFVEMWNNLSQKRNNLCRGERARRFVGPWFFGDSHQLGCLLDSKYGIASKRNLWALEKRKGKRRDNNKGSLCFGRKFWLSANALPKPSLSFLIFTKTSSPR